MYKTCTAKQIYWKKGRDGEKERNSGAFLSQASAFSCWVVSQRCWFKTILRKPRSWIFASQQNAQQFQTDDSATDDRALLNEHRVVQGIAEIYDEILACVDNVNTSGVYNIYCHDCSKKFWCETCSRRWLAIHYYERNTCRRLFFFLCSHPSKTIV